MTFTFNLLEMLKAKRRQGGGQGWGACGSRDLFSGPGTIQFQSI